MQQPNQPNQLNQPNQGFKPEPLHKKVVTNKTDEIFKAITRASYGKCYILKIF